MNFFVFLVLLASQVEVFGDQSKLELFLARGFQVLTETGEHFLGLFFLKTGQNTYLVDFVVLSQEVGVDFV